MATTGTVRMILGASGRPLATLALAVAAAAAPSPATAAKTRAPRPVTVQLKWWHQFQFAGHYAAIEKGYYRQAGLEVRLVEGAPGMDFAREVVAGRDRKSVV
jgi:two-component system sensor histidine kinase/response regulator